MNRLKAYLIVWCLLLQSCGHYGMVGLRAPASSGDTERLEYLLAVDRFHFYLSHLWLHLDGKASTETVETIKKITPTQIMDAGIELDELADAMNFDKILMRMHPQLRHNNAPIKWEYNFLKRKLNEAFILKESRLSIESNFEESSSSTKLEPQGEKLVATAVSSDEMTLDSGKYIADRTTRAIFWEATESGRTVEFHLGDSRNFLHTVTQSGGEVLDEIRPMARNYNKIFLVQYPNEEMPRLAITNIGGLDRLEHMLYHFNLENLSGNSLDNQIVIRGNLEEYHAKLTHKYKTMLEHLPTPNRVMMGQLGAIQGLFSVFESYRKLLLAAKHDPKLLSTIDQKDKLIALLSKDDLSPLDIMANKSIIQNSEAAIRVELDKLASAQGLKPFKEFHYEDNVLSMSDLSFENKNGHVVRWRLVSNVWGDEVVPIARALKEVGQTNVTYMGTAGALPGKGIKVGDLFIPDKVSNGKKVVSLAKAPMNISGAIKSGTVDHVSSPFQESKDWLRNATQNVDTVEIETIYLAEIFDGPKDNLGIYLLVSDVLGSEGETLATASSSKRKKSLEKLLNALLVRDQAGIPSPSNAAESSTSVPENIRAALDSIAGNKNALYRYHVYSMLEKEGGEISPHAIQSLAESGSIESFSDKYMQARLYQVGEVLESIYISLGGEDGARPSIALPKDLVEGAWNPKRDKLEIKILAQTNEMTDILQAALERHDDQLGELDRWFNLTVAASDDLGDDYVFVAPKKIPNRDILLDAVADRAFRKVGLMKSVYEPTGSVSYNFLPTVKSSPLCEIGNKSYCQVAYFEPNDGTKALAAAVDNLNLDQTRNLFDQNLLEVNQHLEQMGERERWMGQAKRVIVDSLPDGRLAQITPVFDEAKGVIFEVRMTTAGWNNPLVILEELAHLKQIGPSYESLFKHPLYFASVSLNAMRGSKKSAAQLLTAEVQVQEIVRAIINGQGNMTPQIDSYLSARTTHAEKQLAAMSKELKAENKVRKNLAAQWKDLQSDLEDQAKKLDDYIAANDRKKVAELISSFLPWENMEPTEISTWNNWIGAISKPASEVSASEKVLLFRGLEGDNLRQSNDGGHFLMSSMLNKNQGNYTRRLRSLKTYRNKLNGKVNGGIPYEVGSVVNSLKGHSHEPVGSPFISTSVLDIASGFKGYGDEAGLAAIHISRDRIFGNLVSDYREFEKLIPMIVFPDEIVHLAQGVDEISDFRADVKAKLGRDIKTPETQRRALSRIEETKTWWSLMQGADITPNSVPRTCKGIMEYFMGNL